MSHRLRFSRALQASCIALGSASAIATPAMAAPGVAVPVAGAAATDLGATSSAQVVTASIILKVRHPERLERAVAATEDPGGGSYHKFTTLSDFVAEYAPSSSDIASIKRYLDRFGIQVTDVYADQLLLKVSGTVAAFNTVFDTDLHDYARNGRRFHCPRRSPSIPTLFRDLLLAVGGLNDDRLFHPMHVDVRARSEISAPSTVLPTAGTLATGVPGSYTVGDVANLYDINPLYAAHVDGTGRTIGIATLANFNPKDAFTYWGLIGLAVDGQRITQVHVDGGGELSAEAGSARPRSTSSSPAASRRAPNWSSTTPQTPTPDFWTSFTAQPPTTSSIPCP